MEVMKRLKSKASHDARWIEDAQGGDRSAFDQLLRRYYPQIHGTLFRLVGNPEDADDLAQETFVKAWVSLRFYRKEASFGAWLTKIALHLATDFFRSRGRRGELGDMTADLASQCQRPDEELSHKEARSLVAEAVDELPTHLKTALVLRVLEGRDYSEVAEATGLRIGTVRTQVMRARKILKRMLKPMLDARRKS